MLGIFKASKEFKDLLLSLETEVGKIKKDLIDIKEALEKVEIKSLENRKLYHKKLKELYDKEEGETKDIYNGVLLKESGNT